MAKKQVLNPVSGKFDLITTYEDVEQLLDEINGEAPTPPASKIGQVLTANGDGTASFLGASRIDIPGSVIDMHAGDLFYKSLTEDTEVTVENLIPGKTILFICVGNGFNLNLAGGTRVSDKLFNKSQQNRIRLTAESDNNFSYEIVSTTDNIIDLERNSTIDLSKSNLFKYTGGWGSSTFEIINSDNNRSVLFEIYSEDIITLRANGSENILNDLPDYCANVTDGEINTIEFRNGRFRVIPPSRPFGYNREKNEITAIFDSTLNLVSGAYIEAANNSDISVIWGNDGRKIKYSSGEIYRRGDFIESPGMARFFSKDGIKIISFKPLVTLNLGSSMLELNLNAQPFLEIIDFYGVGNLFYSFNNQPGVIDLNRYAELKYFRLLNLGTFQSVHFQNCSKMQKISIDNPNITLIELPDAIVSSNFSFSTTSPIADNVVNSILATVITYNIPAGIKSINLTGSCAAPTGQGLIDKNALIAAGWTVQTN